MVSVWYYRHYYGYRGQHYGYAYEVDTAEETGFHAL